MPSSELVERAVELMGRSATHSRHFFDKLDSASWIEPLRDRGFFSSPPPRQQSGDYFSFPDWPEARYLARVASQRPALVLETILEFRDTDNERIHEACTDAAIAMPGDVAARWAAAETDWLRHTEHLYLLLPEKLAELAIHLAREGEIGPGLDLVRELLRVRQELPGQVERDEAELAAMLSIPRVRSRFDEHEYGEIVRTCLPALVEIVGREAWELACELLEGAVRASLRDPDETRPCDYSYVWRPAIAEHEQNLGHDLRSDLVVAVRDGATALVAREPTSLQDLVESLENREWQVFRRVSLYLLADNMDEARASVAARLTDPDLFSDFGVRHEYYHLLRIGFPRLESEAQDRLLSMVESGPNLESFRANFEGSRGRPPQAADEEGFVARWQLEQLLPIRDSLPGGWSTTYAELAAKVGEPKHSEFPFYHLSSSGPSSPLRATEILEMSDEDIIRYLSDWRPSPETEELSIDALAMTLQRAIASDVGRFALLAPRFEALRPVYLRSLLYALREAVKERATLDWKPVLELTRSFATSRLEAEHERDWTAHYESGSSAARIAVGHLLQDALAASLIPFTLREEVWQSLWPVGDDPEPTEQQEAKEGEKADFVSMSLNTIRGAAMHALVQYGLWTRQNLGDDWEGLQSATELRKFIERHLNPAIDQSRTTRSVFGQRFNALFLLDGTWAASMADSVFQNHDAESRLGDVAWSSYILWSGPIRAILPVLRAYYEAAVDNLDTLSRDEAGFSTPGGRLGEHLMTFYWWGDLDLEPESLLTSFFAKAPPRIREHAVRFVGESLERAVGEVAEETLDRLRALWEWRVAQLEGDREVTSESIDEVAAFGRWFSSQKFDATWGIDQLERQLRLVGKTYPDHTVVEALSRLPERQLPQVLKCLGLMLGGLQEPWRAHGWKKEARPILAQGLAHQSREVRETARQILDQFGLLGHLDMRDLLSGDGA